MTGFLPQCDNSLRWKRHMFVGCLTGTKALFDTFTLNMRVQFLALFLAVILNNAFGDKYDEELCGIGWKSYKNNCYTIQVSSKTWQQSKDDCVARNAQLVKLTDLEELNYVYNTFIRPLHGQSAWIGLSKIDGRFQWQDGSNVTFSNWNFGEPNNFGGVEKCVELFVDSGKWNDIECKHPKPSICKKAKVMVHPENLVMASLSNVDFALRDHTIQKLSARDVMECSSFCFAEPNCFSINYQYIYHGNNPCELNNSTKAVAKPGSFVERPGYIYYD